MVQPLARARDLDCSALAAIARAGRLRARLEPLGIARPPRAGAAARTPGGAAGHAERPAGRRPRAPGARRLLGELVRAVRARGAGARALRAERRRARAASWASTGATRCGCARRSSRRYGWTFPNLRDGEGTVGNEYRMTGLPTTFVLDAAGRIRTVLRGPQTVGTLVTALARAERSWSGRHRRTGTAAAGAASEAVDCGYQVRASGRLVVRELRTRTTRCRRTGRVTRRKDRIA